MSNTVKENIIKQLAVDMDISEDIISKVVSFQGEDSLIAVKTYNEVEYSGLGKFYLSQPKIKRRLESLYRMSGLISKHDIPDQVKLEGISKEIDKLKTKLKDEA